MDFYCSSFNSPKSDIKELNIELGFLFSCKPPLFLLWADELALANSSNVLALVFGAPVDFKLSLVSNVVDRKPSSLLFSFDRGFLLTGSYFSLGKSLFSSWSTVKPSQSPAFSTLFEGFEKLVTEGVEVLVSYNKMEKYRKPS